MKMNNGSTLRRFAYLLIVAYAGLMFGEVLFSGLKYLDMSLFHPFGALASIGMAAKTPIANISLIVSLLISMILLFRSFSNWIYLLPFISFTSVSYLVRVMWRTG
jgi:hypothetical protein